MCKCVGWDGCELRWDGWCWGVVCNRCMLVLCWYVGMGQGMRIVELVVLCVFRLVCVWLILVSGQCWLMFVFIFFDRIMLNSLVVVVLRLVCFVMYENSVGCVKNSELCDENFFELIGGSGFDVLLKLMKQLSGVRQLSELMQVFLLIELQMIGMFVLFVIVFMCCVKFLCVQMIGWLQLCVFVSLVFLLELIVLIMVVLSVFVYWYMSKLMLLVVVWIRIVLLVFIGYVWCSR